MMTTRRIPFEQIQSYFVDQAIIDLREALMSTGLTKTEANNLIYGGGIKFTAP